MRELIMSVLCSVLFYLLMVQAAECVAVGLSGGIPEEAAEDENCG